MPARPVFVALLLLGCVAVLLGGVAFAETIAVPLHAEGSATAGRFASASGMTLTKPMKMQKP